ncbi:amino acid adenylation domain-containing protein [Roseivirga sp. BDSF3-8]|uniref:amino acid adenylation domain-containing protein n=1 Tax=Roseivirga sp. BDSF3-8 TaxID=3241598 RepID=UPI00353276D5
MSNILDQAPLSYIQERLWFIDTFEKNNLYQGGPVYHNLPLVIKIQGSLSVEALRKSIIFLTERHEILRCTVGQEGDNTTLSVHENLPVPVQILPLPQVETEDDITATIRELVNEPFEIEEEPLHRVTLLTGTTDHFAVWTFHHIIADKHSLNIFYKELAHVYKAFAKGQTPLLQDLDLQYIDYSIWQKELPADVLESLLLYWKHKLKAPIQALEIPCDRTREHVHIYRGATSAFSLNKEAGVKLKSLSESLGISEKALFYTAYQVMLYRYSGLDEIVTGTYGTNHISHLPDSAGPADNLLVIRTFIENGETFVSLARKTEASLNEAIDHQDMPFEQLSTLLNPAKDMSRTAFFDILFHYEEKEEGINTGAATWNTVETNMGLGKYDHNLLICKENDQYVGYLTYNELYYEKGSIENFCQNLCHLLEVISQESASPISSVPILSEEQSSSIMKGMDYADVKFPRDENIISRFDKIVNEYPERTAVKYEGSEYSYKELQQFSNRFANFLREEKLVTEGDLVTVTLPRSSEMLGVLLGILKAGACYIPVDPTYPQERIQFILEDSNSKVEVTESVLSEFIAKGDKISSLPTDVNTDGESLAYIIYTSGTTGKPKGVKVCHRNVIRLLFNEANLFDFDQNDVWTLFHSYCFDFSVWEMYGALLYGGKVVVVPAMTAKDTEGFYKLLKEDNVTILNQTPSAFYRLAEVDHRSNDKLSALRMIVYGGEALAPVKLRNWYEKYSDTQLINMYGITETTVHVTYKQITLHEIENNISSIGRPIPTLGCFVLDQNQCIVPRGVSGELYVYGEGVAQGYLNRPDLTKEKFTEVPLLKGQKVYRSGDLARILANGELEYLGRIDSQVKIRGHRIELGELESNLLKNKGVKDAVVTTRKDDAGQAYLVAYYTTEDNLSAKDLRIFIQELIPGYMIPSYFVPVDEIPLTSNGKVDTKKLPDPSDIVQDNATEYVAPETSTEVQLAQIWMEILGLSRVGKKDNFFEIGGHSLKATQLVSRIRERLGASLKLSDIFAHPVLAELATVISGADENLETIIPLAGEREHYPLSPAQKRLWVLQQMEEGSTTYNIYNAFVICRDVDPEIMKLALESLIKRHSSLRTSFNKVDEEVFQKVHEVYDLEECFSYHDFSNQNLSEADIITRVRQMNDSKFDLSNLPLFKINLIRWKDDAYIFSYVMHHIISDGWSMNIFFSEITRYYQAASQGTKADIGSLPFQYTDYAVWFGEQVKSGKLKEQGEYWKSQFEEGWLRTDLGVQKDRPAVKTYNGSKADFLIDAQLLKGLKATCQQNGVTLFMGLHSVLNGLISQYTHLNDTIIGVPVAGRDGTGLEKQIGFYVNTLAVRTRFNPKNTFIQLLKNTAEQDKKAFENQLYPFDQLVEELKLKRDVSRSPLFDMMLVLQNTGDLNLENTSSSDTDILVSPLNLGVEGSKFDLTWFFAETEEGLYLRMEFNSDLYDTETIYKLKEHFRLLLEKATTYPDFPLSELKVLTANDEESLQVYRNKLHQQPLEIAGLYHEQENGRPAYQSPETHGEIILASIWEQLLNVLQPGLGDDFFALGGDSIKAIQLVSLLKKHDYSLTVPLVMRYSGLREMAKQLSKGHTQTEEERVIGELPLSPVQHYFFEKVSKYNHHYNQSVVLVGERFDQEKINLTLKALCDAHDMLRAVYKNDEGTWKQLVQDESKVNFFVHDLQNHTFDGYSEEIDKLATQHQSDISLVDGPLFSAALFRLKDQDRLLLFAHHLIVDGVSWRIIIDDFKDIYQALTNGTKMPALSRTHSYKRWSETLTEMQHSDRVSNSLDLWNIDKTSITNLSFKKETKNNLEEDVCTCQGEVGERQIAAIQQAANQWVGTDLQDILIAALNMAIQQNVGNGEVSLMMESHGRDAIKHLDLSRTVGWFTAIYPVLLPEVKDQDLLLYLIDIKERLRRFQRAGSNYGIAKYLSGRSMTEDPQMCFNYLGQFDSGEKEQGSSITLSTEARGKERAAEQDRLFSIDFTAALVDKKLQFSIKYNKNQYSAEVINALVEAWKTNLLEFGENLTKVEKTFLTPSDFRTVGLSMSSLISFQQKYKLENVYGLSPLQQSFFFHHIRFPKTSAYFEQMRYRLKGDICPETFHKTVKALSDRHPVMRSLFRDDLASQPVQAVISDIAPVYNFEVIKDLSSSDKEFRLDKFAEEDREKGFRLTEELPIRFRLFQLAHDEFEFILSYHHIIMDGWCIPIIMNDFQKLYTAFRSEVQPLLPDLEPFENYINWLENYPQEKGEEYWRKLLQGYQYSTSIGISKTEQTFNESSRDLQYEEIRLEGELFHNLEAMIRNSRTTLNEVIQALWSIYLAQTNDRHDVVFGTVVSGRPSDLEGVEGMVGLFINTMPVRIRFEENESVSNLIGALRNQAIEGMPYHYTQLANLQRLHPDGKLFDHIMVFRNYPVDSEGESPWELTGIKAYEPNSFDFTIHVLPEPDMLKIRFVYHPEKYSVKDVSRIKQIFSQMMEAFVDNPHQMVDEQLRKVEEIRKSFRKSGRQNRLSMLKTS